MVMAMMLQNFNFQLDDPAYNLRIKQTLTIKPQGLKIRSSLRHGMSSTDLEQILHAGEVPKPGLAPSIPDGMEKHVRTNTSSPTSMLPMTILYGSNTGTCRTFAERLALNATAHGFEATVKDMDVCTGLLPKTQPVIVITASYEGQPPDNAARFVGWLKTLEAKALEDVHYAVFGCGHSMFLQLKSVL
jgi:cytochrome P450/NADPH-cytochrome P450 reductase